MESVLKNFKVFGANPALPFVSITVNGVSFSKDAIELLGYPEFVTLYLNPNQHQFAVQPSEQNGTAQPFLKKGKDKKRPFVRWNNKNVIGPILKMLPDAIDANGVRVYGEYYEKENCIIFDCSHVDKLTRGKKKSE